MSNIFTCIVSKLKRNRNISRQITFDTYEIYTTPHLKGVQLEVTKREDLLSSIYTSTSYMKIYFT